MRGARAVVSFWLTGLLGCSAGTSPSPGGAASDAGAGGDGSSDVVVVDARADAAPPDVSFALPDAAPPPDFAPPPVALPLPPGVPPPRRLLQGEDRMAGEGQSACSEPATPTADRFCVFYRAGAAPGATELWVINLSKAAAGKVPACDGSSPDCVRLTSTLWTGAPVGGPSHPYSHQFSGDTLFFYADSAAGPLQLYHGPVYAWRPGWPSPRSVTSPAGLMCFGHPRVPVAFCLDALSGDAMMPDSFELRVGSLAEIPAGPLPSLGRFRVLRAGGARGWQAGFSPDGRTFAISSPDPDPSIEVLRAVPVAGVGSQAPTEVLHGATNWAISNDGKRIYYMREDAPDQLGLYAADFPAGTGEIKLGGRTEYYELRGEGATDEGVAFITSLGPDYGAFRFIRDSHMPEAFVTVFSYHDLLEGVHTSADLRYTAWVDYAFRARVVRNADRSSCLLNTYGGLGAYEPQMLGSAGLVFWSEDTPGNDGRRDAFFGRPDDCTGTQRFATAIAYYAPLGDRGVVYTDESDAVQSATLKYAVARKTGAAWGLDTPVRVHGGLDEGFFTLLGSPPTFVLFRTSGPEAGTWVFGPLPL